MKSICFVSNYYNHHQASFSNRMYELTEHNFCFIETMPMEQERKNMGWGNDNIPDYVLRAYENTESLQNCKKIIYDADAVIWGSCPFDLIKPRLKKEKLTFKYSERLFKDKSLIKNIGRILKYKFSIGLYQKNHYLLCASAYAADDYYKLNIFKDRAFKFGYFPELKIYDDIEALLDKKMKNSILWAARLIPLKHPEIPIQMAAKLKSDGYDFELNIIGSGELEEKLKLMINESGLSDNVHMLGMMTQQDVRKYMEQSSIFLFTSDQNEGWGAVINESMNSACAVIANSVIGSVPFLINDNVNGLVYNDTDELYKKIKYLINNDKERKQIGANAYRAICDKWNADIAAKRLYSLIDEIEKGNSVDNLFSDGVCSK